MKTINKGIVRKEMELKKGGRTQISSHGAGEFSIQIIRAGKVNENCTIPPEIVKKARNY